MTVAIAAVAITAIGMCRRGLGVSSARLAAVSKPMNSSTPYSMPKMMPGQPSSAADGWPGIIFGMLYGVLLFIGFETAANLAEETPNPRRHIPIAVMATAAIATVMYVVATYVEVAGFHYDLKSLTAAAAAPLFALGAPASA